MRTASRALFLMLSPVSSISYLSLSGLMMAILYARGNFVLPTFAGVIFNAAIAVSVLGLHERLGIASIAVGVTIGGLAQLILQLPAVSGIHYQLLLDLGHSAIRRILRLYAPLILGIIFSVICLSIYRWLAAVLPSAMRPP